MTTIEELARMEIVEYRNVYIINKGRKNEAKVIASGIDEAVKLYYRQKGDSYHVYSIEEIEHELPMYVI